VADPVADDWSGAAILATEDGLAGRSACVLLEGERFVRPADGPAAYPLKGVRIQTVVGREGEALVMTPAESGARLPDPLSAVRMLAKLGVERLLILADAEPLRDGLGPLETVRDHVNLGAWNPLVGPNDDRFGPRFPDLSEAYDPGLRAHLDAGAGLSTGGIVIASTAPGAIGSITSDAAAWSTLGVDAATDGVVPVVIVARHAGIRVATVVAFESVAVSAMRGLVDVFLDCM